MDLYYKYWECSCAIEPLVNSGMYIGHPQSRNNTHDCAAPISAAAYKNAIVPDEYLRAIGRGVHDG
jgi:hypothetical protein